MKRWVVFAVMLIIVFIPGIIGGLFTTDAVRSDWYLQNRPPFTPPNYVFPIVWSILYFLIALSLYFCWMNADKKGKKNVAIVFGINLLANALWSILFFGLENALLAFIDLVLIWITIIVMIFVAGKIDKKSAWFLLPYLLWVSFAGFLHWAFL